MFCYSLLLSFISFVFYSNQKLIRNSCITFVHEIIFFLSILGVFYITLPETSPQDRRRGDSNIHQNLAHKAHSQQTSLSSSTRSIVILQSSERPPHFFLQLDGKERVEISAGRNNLFHTLLFFLYHIKSKESGQLGRINLGISGVNMLWVINNPN